LKTLKDFISEQVVEEPKLEIVVENVEPETLDVEELPNLLGEEGKKKDMDPPAVLLMKRKSIRQFPNGQRVALYYVDKINKYVTVPYSAMQWSESSSKLDDK
jgi:hypothetical protein